MEIIIDAQGYRNTICAECTDCDCADDCKVYGAPGCPNDATCYQD